MENKIAKRYRLCSNCSYRIASGKCNGKCKEYWKYIGATKQKAIYDAELSKLKSALENEKQINRRYYNQGYYDAFKKACKWFTDYLMEIGYSDDWMRDSPNILSGEERFIKAMEK